MTNSDPHWKRDEPDSPCLAVCVQHRGAGLCVGCFRTPEEVANWARFTPEDRARILRELPGRAPRLRAAGARPSRRRRRPPG